MRHSLACDLWVPASIDDVWNFMRDSKNLAVLSPKSQHASVESDGFARDGQKIVIHLAPLGFTIPLPWIAALSEVVSKGPKRQFVDVQEKGPFRYWRHQHHLLRAVIRKSAATARLQKSPLAVPAHGSATVSNTKCLGDLWVKRRTRSLRDVISRIFSLTAAPKRMNSSALELAETLATERLE